MSSSSLCGIASNLNTTADEVKTIITAMIVSCKNQIGAKASDIEIALVATICHKYDLNPMTRECHAFTGKNGLQVMIGVDGWIKIMNRHPDFDGIELSENIDQHNKLISVTCKIHKKNTSYPVTITEYLDENFVSTSEVWRKRPKRMLRNRAISQCVRIAFGLSELLDLDEIKEYQEAQTQEEKDITPENKTSNINEIFQNTPPQKKNNTSSTEAVIEEATITTKESIIL